MGFNEAAASWDIDERVSRAKVLFEAMIKIINPNKSMTALEVGCGTGLITFGVNDKFEKVYCIDTSEEMIKVLKSKIEKNNINNVYPYNAEEIYSEKFYGNFDVVYSSMVFHHILDIEDQVKKLYKLIKKDGYLVIIDLDEEDGSFHKNEKDFRGHNGFNRESLTAILNKYGYSEVVFKTIFEGKREICNEEIDYSLFLCLAKVY